MTTSISSINSTQSALQVNGVNSVVFDNTGLVSGADLGIKTIDATVASNAITVTFAANQTTEFRSTTLTSGTVTQLTNTSALSLVIAATNSFAAVTAGGNQRIAILVINNAGTMELAAANLAGGVSLDETGVITTVTAATTAIQIKSTTARTSVAYRVVGFVDVPFTTAVGYGAIVKVQGTGGQALAAMSSLGYGQTWQNMTGSRSNGTTYYNTTGRPIFIAVYGGTGGATSTITINGAMVLNQSASGLIGGLPSCSAVIPPGNSYAPGYNGTGATVYELR